ncbi:MAG: F0F1 ATP synthase subunit A [Acidobacteria bacterium]|nr:F0F1 ATP synthase subunit A [Acidobacteriota bacterium]MBI3656866.1 F0F1 ATP synthase subunit A [Acidobacteriota bacterium]
MEEHEFFLSEPINLVVGKVLSLMGVNVRHGDKIVPDHMILMLLVGLIIIVFAVYLRRRLSVDRPGAAQHMIESLVEALRQQQESIIGHHDYKRYLPFLGTLGLFILISNLIGLIPYFQSPTANTNLTFGCAIIAFLYYHWQGIRKQGLWHYLKHFAGPIWWLAPLMIPIEIISHFSRILSLGVRLFANIYGEDMVIAVFAFLFPLLLPLPLMFLAVFTSVLQAFVFVLLTIIYLAGVVAEEH